MSKNQSRKPSRDVKGGKGKTSSYNDAKRLKSSGYRDSSSKGGSSKRNVRSGSSNAGGSRGSGASRGKGGAYKKNSQTGTDAIFGKHAVIEALESGVPLQGIMFAEGISTTSDAIAKIRDLAAENGASIETVPRARIDERADGAVHQGVMAIAEPYSYSSVEAIAEDGASLDAALVIVLDHITDVGNFGAIVRTAEVVGATGVVIPNKRSVEVVSSVYKTSAGAVSRMKIAKVSNIGNACDTLRDAGFWVAGASEKAENDCWDSPMDGRIALVMGSEGEGISKLVQQKCDFLVQLPQRGRIGSLNVSCATAALAYEWMRQSTAKGQL